MSLTKTVQIGGKEYKFELQKYAKQAAGSVMVSCGGTQVLVTVCASSSAREGQSFFPLTVDYFEKFYAAGRIPGGFFKREAKPTEGETLTARCIDRPLRPSFPKSYMCDTHVVATVVSHDKSAHPASLATIGASMALMISDLPFDGPIAGLRVGMNSNDEFVIDPSEAELEKLDLTVAAKPGAVLMVEAGAKFLSEEKIIDAIDFAHKEMEPLFDLQNELRKEIGKPKREVEASELPADVYAEAESFLKGKLEDAVAVSEKIARGKTLKALSKEMRASLNPDGDAAKAEVLADCFDKIKSQYVRQMVLNQDVRMDGRKLNEIRHIACETNVLKKAHGSSLFTRGETQALGVITLGSSDDAQRMDSIHFQDYHRRFMLHYNFPPFSVGEARPMRGPGRREIGHGNLAQRALEQVLPDKEEFGYTIRAVSEVLESNGSSSMATVCSCSMAMMQAGVPIKAPVAGIAMGLIHEGDKYQVLSDILGDEDHLGDMDFKVCGTKDGITALQMDIKISGLPREVLVKALHQAKDGRLHILEKMNATIAGTSELSDNAPRIFTVKVDPSKIRDVIGPGGKNIKRITAECGVKLDIGDDGMIKIVAPSTDEAELAKKAIREVVTEPEVGRVYLGTVIKVMDFGAFVEIKPGTEGLVHISQLDHSRVEKVEDVAKEGDEMMVKLIEIDKLGRLKLSRKEALAQGKPN